MLLQSNVNRIDTIFCQHMYVGVEIEGIYVRTYIHILFFSFIIFAQKFYEINASYGGKMCAIFTKYFSSECMLFHTSML